MCYQLKGHFGNIVTILTTRTRGELALRSTQEQEGARAQRREARWEAFFGKDLVALQGKTTRSAAKHVGYNTVVVSHKILKQYSKVTLCIDKLFETIPK